MIASKQLPAPTAQPPLHTVEATAHALGARCSDAVGPQIFLKDAITYHPQLQPMDTPKAGCCVAEFVTM